MEILPLGDNALVINFETSGFQDSYQKIREVYLKLKAAAPQGIYDIVPCYGSMGIYYNSVRISTKEVMAFIDSAIGHRSTGNLADTGIEPTQLITIPVYYGGGYGPDLALAAEHLGISPEELITEHINVTYTVLSIGFLPGFPYMGSLSSKIRLPRKETPAPKVPAGSVAIAGGQTGIYPFESPGGWHIIGWTPLNIFDLARDDPGLFKPGDRVKFVQFGGAYVHD